MGIGNMITKLFNKKESSPKNSVSADGYEDFDSIIPPLKPRTKSFLINKTINFYSEDLEKLLKGRNSNKKHKKREE